MLEKPDLHDSQLIACLNTEFAWAVDQLTFLPLGADQNTAVYRAVTIDSQSYFVKLRRGAFDEMGVVVPTLLHSQGIASIIAPLTTRSRQLWAKLDTFNVMLYPYIEGRNGYEVVLSQQQWSALGQALKAMHTAPLPPDVTTRIQRETYSAHWRDSVKQFQAQAAATTFADPVAAQLASLLNAHRAEVNHLVNRAEQLAAVLHAQTSEFVLCHADIHAGNILVDIDGTLYIVDWDTLILAPKERDLMFFGGGQGWAGGLTAAQEEALFYRGYGQTVVDPVALVYYRFERIVQDIAAYCEQILLTDGGGEDRQNGLRQLSSQFQPGAVIDIAFQSERHLPPHLSTG